MYVGDKEVCGEGRQTVMRDAREGACAGALCLSLSCRPRCYTACCCRPVTRAAVSAGSCCRPRCRQSFGAGSARALSIALINIPGAHPDNLRGAQELVRIRRQRERLVGAGSTMSALSMQATAMASSVAMAGAMGAAGKTMAALNKRMEAADVRGSLRAFAVESERMGMTEEMLDDSLADAFGDDDEEAEAEIVSSVLDEIGIDLRASLAPAPRGGVAAAEAADPEQAVSEEETNRVLASLGIASA